MNKTINIPTELVGTDRKTEMVIELKNIRINHSFSEETVCFTSDLYVDGKRLCRCKNDGHGGNTDYDVYRVEDRPLVKRVEEICKTLPKWKSDLVEGKEWDYTLEYVIDEMIGDHVNNLEKKRFETKKQKDMLKCLVLSKGVEGQYDIVSWKGHTIQSMLQKPNGVEMLKKTVSKYRLEGYMILNTNLPTEVLS